MLEFQIIEQASAEDEHEIKAGLYQFNQRHIGDYQAENVIIKVTDAGKVVAGISGSICWQWGYIARLWVNENYRTSAIGKQLVNSFEEVCLGKSCLGIRLETTSFQAKGFYLKLGFTQFGEIDNFPPNHTCYFLKKELNELHSD